MGATGFPKGMIPPQLYQADPITSAGFLYPAANGALQAAKQATRKLVPSSSPTLREELNTAPPDLELQDEETRELMENIERALHILVEV